MNIKRICFTLMLLIMTMALLGLGGSFAASATASGPAAAGANGLVINEFVFNHTGTDTNAFIEVKGNPSTDYSSYTVLEIEGDSGGSLGVVDAVLPVTTTNALGYWTSPEDVENGTVSLLLVENFTGALNDDLDTDDDGIPDVMPWTSLVDSVAVSDGGTGDLTYGDVALEPGFDGVAFSVGGASRIPDGLDSDSPYDWVRNDYDGAGFPGFTGTPTAGESFNTPGAENAIVPLINEFVFNHTGTDTNAFIEVKGNPSTDYSSYTVLEIEGDSGGSLGVVDAVLPVTTTNALGYWISPEDAENGTVSLLLVENFTGTVDIDLDTDDDGVLDSTPWDSMIDSVAISDGDAGDMTYGDVTLEPGFDGVSFSVGGSSRIPDGYDSNTPDDWVRNDYDGAGFPGFTGSPMLGEAVNTPGAENRAVPGINEFVFNHTGTDTNAFIEVKGSPTTDYSSYTVLEIEGDSGDSLGVVDAVLPVTTTNALGYWTSPEDAENGTVSLLLVENFTGTVDIDLDTDDDGVLDNMPWDTMIDSVAVSDGDAGDMTYGDVTLEPGFDGGSFTVGGASRIPDGLDTNTPDDWMRNDYDGAGFPGFTGTPTVGEAYNTPGAANEAVELPPVAACGEPATLINTIQGTGDVSPLEGQLGVEIEGIVVADFQPGDSDFFSTDLGGFYVQEEAADYDADDTTSEGIFVYGPGAADVEVGDVVRLAGEVDEYVTSSGASSMTQIRLGSDILECGTATVPDPVTLVLPVASLDIFEQYEGMLVRFAQQLVITEYFNFDRYNEIVVSEPIAADRPFQPTSYIDPDTDEAAIADALDLIARSRIMIDDARSVQNPPLLRHPNGQVFDLNNRFRGGDTVQDLTGVLDETFGRYRLQPTESATYTAQNLRPEEPEAVGGTLQVAAFNVLNYFLTIDEGSDICGPNLDMECRGADNDEEFQRQRAKILAALEAIGADVFGLIEMENTTGVEPLADIVAGLNDSLGPNTYAYIDTGVVGTDAIRQGIIYQPATVTPVGDYAVLDDPAFTNPLDYATPKSRPAVAQTFENNATGEIFTVVVNHLKSKGSECGEGDDDPYQGNCNLTRTMAADYLMDWLATDPTDSGVDNNLIIGDLNAYDKEDPIDEIVEGPDDILGTADDYVDLLLLFEGEFAYTYVFDGQLGYLDYALANLNLLPRVTGANAWHINADEPDILDYDTSFKPPEQDILYESNAYRSSDHDPVIVGLFADTAALSLNKEAHAATVIGGDSITYTLTITSNGLLTATNVVLTDTLPAGSTYQMADTTHGTCEMVGVDLVCLLGDLEPGEQAVVTLVVDTPLDSLTLTNVAVVSTDVDELDLTDNTAEVSVVVTRHFIYLPLILNAEEPTR